MIIYDKTWLANLQVIKDAEQAQHQGLLSAAELAGITEAYPVGFYTPGVFVRAGFFILTSIICILSCGVLSLLALDSHVITSFGWLLFLGLCCYVALELMVKEKKYFHSGVDEALLYMAGALFIGGILVGFNNQHDDVRHIGDICSSLCILILSICLTLRFADAITTIAAFASFFCFVFLSWTDIGPSGEATLSFITMALSGLIYIIAERINLRSNVVNYHTCLDVLKILSLLTLYAAGNYFVVQKVSNELHGVPYEQNTSVPFGLVFWLWTIALPFVYISLGIRKKDVILLRTGLLIIAAAVFTFRNYYHLLPIEMMLTLAGLIIIGLAYSIHRYLKTPKHGFTQEPLTQNDMMDNLKVESLIVAGTLSDAPAPTDPGFQFGGGTAGGGGSSAGY